jgi:hypothetical protein
MSYRKITFQKALDLEALGLIKIYSPGDFSQFHQIAKEWYTNFQELSYKYKKVPVGSILDFIGVDYVVDVLTSTNQETGRYTWVYLYAQDISTIRDKQERDERGKWVYILTNKAYPDLVKIGKAVNPEDRIRGINSAGTVSEWELRIAFPVTNDYKVENMVHRHFEDRRVDSDQGSSREFFRVTFDEAVKVLDYVSKDFFAGDPKIF